MVWKIHACRPARGLRRVLVTCCISLKALSSWIFFPSNLGSFFDCFRCTAGNKGSSVQEDIPASGNKGCGQQRLLSPRGPLPSSRGRTCVPRYPSPPTVCMYLSACTPVHEHHQLTLTLTTRTRTHIRTQQTLDLARTHTRPHSRRCYIREILIQYGVHLAPSVRTSMTSLEAPRVCQLFLLMFFVLRLESMMAYYI